MNRLFIFDIFFVLLCNNIVIIVRSLSLISICSILFGHGLISCLRLRLSLTKSIIVAFLSVFIIVVFVSSDTLILVFFFSYWYGGLLLINLRSKLYHSSHLLRRSFGSDAPLTGNSRDVAILRSSLSNLRILLLTCLLNFNGCRLLSCLHWRRHFNNWSFPDDRLTGLCHGFLGGWLGGRLGG